MSILHATSAAAYLRLVFAAPAAAVGRAQMLLDLAEADRNLALIHIALHYPDAVADALDAVCDLPCFDGCGHDRHVGPCMVALADPDGPCGCGSAAMLAGELRADELVEYGDDERHDALAERDAR